MRQPRHAEPSQILLPEFAQPLPFAREVSCQKQNQQNLHHFDGLEWSEIYARIAAGWPRSPDQERQKQSERGQQRRVGPARETLVVKRAQQRQQQKAAARRAAPREFSEL